MALKVGVIGVGYLGQFHVEKYANLPEVELVGVMDIRTERAREIAHRYQCIAFSSLEDLLKEVEAVSIVVPTNAHYEIASICLKEGKHVLLEKPMAESLTQADTLIAIAKEKGVIFQVGHLERFNPAVVALFDLLDKPLFIESHRLGLSLKRGTEVDVILDLMIHDLDIILNIVKSKVIEIRAVGVPVVSRNIDIANVRLEFESGCIANLTASRISIKGVRKIRFFQKDAYFSLDYAKRELVIIRRGINVPFSKKHLHFGGDPLKEEVKSFVQSVKNNKPPLVSGEDGRKALALALEINSCIKKRLR